MEVVIGLIVGIVIGTLMAGVVIWLISKLNLGLKVDNFGWAMLAGLMIGVLTNLVLHFMTDFGGLVDALVRVVVSAGAIFASGKILRGLSVNGVKGALLASLVLALIHFAMSLLAGAMTPA